MAKSSSSMETIKLSSTIEGLSAGQEARQNSVRNSDYTPGKYLFLPMDHFCTDVRYNGADYKSKRVIMVHLDDNNQPDYGRTFKISYFTEMLAALKADGMPVVQTELNNEGRIRVVSGALTYTPSTTSRIPKSVQQRGKLKMLHIDAPFVINYKGILSGYVVSYKETAKGSNQFDVETNADGTARFQATNITQFDVDENFTITDELISKAKSIIAADPQLSSVKID